MPMHSFTAALSGCVEITSKETASLYGVNKLMHHGINVRAIMWKTGFSVEYSPECVIYWFHVWPERNTIMKVTWRSSIVVKAVLDYFAFHPHGKGARRTSRHKLQMQLVLNNAEVVHTFSWNCRGLSRWTGSSPLIETMATSWLAVGTSPIRISVAIPTTLTSPWVLSVTPDKNRENASS
jgi:hypothetical protein